MLYKCPNCNGFDEVWDMLLGSKVTCPWCQHAISSLEARQLAKQLRLSNDRSISRQISTFRQIAFFAILGVLVLLTTGIADAMPGSMVRVWWSKIAATNDKDKPKPEPPQVTYEPVAKPDETTRVTSTSPKETPEPGTLVLLSVGAVGLLAYAWRRRKAIA